MNAKLARIERAEAEYMENHKLKEQEAVSEVEKDVSSRLGEGEASVEDANTEEICKRWSNSPQNV